MREAIAAAAVGDDVYGEDPTVRRLEELAAAMLGHGAALFVPSGTIGNQIAIHYELGEKDAYILKGDPDGETYEPRFTLHPVRYVRVEGLEGKPTPDTVLGREVYSDVDMHGRFTCSNDLLNQIHGNIQRSLRLGVCLRADRLPK